MITPPEGTEFFVGEIFTLTGVGFDVDGKELNESQISWEVRKHHAGTSRKSCFLL
jgi:hypothetical protein